MKLLLLFILAGCATAKHSYREGDVIEYRFNGTYVDSDAFVTKKVISVHEDNVWLAVKRRGSGLVDREWRELFKDDLEYRRLHNLIKLVEIVDGNERELKPTRPELERMYQGTLLLPFGKVDQVNVEHKIVKVCGKRYKALHETGRQKINGENYYYDEVTSEDFPWYHISTRYWRGQETYFQAQIYKCR